MSKFVETANVKVAASRAQHFDLSHKTITTQDISLLTPISVKELVPGDNFNIKVSSFVRLAPLPCPTYGDIKLVNRAFYVPFRLIFKGFEKFITRQPYTDQQGLTVECKIPRIKVRAIYDAFVFNENGLTEEVGQGDEYDFLEPNGHRRCFTYVGKRLYQLLVSLGYQVYRDTRDDYVSLLPILAYLKIYADWYYPSQFAYRARVEWYFNQPNLHIETQADAYSLITKLEYYEVLEKDYFTSAFLDPNGSSTTSNVVDMQSQLYGWKSGSTASALEGLVITNGMPLPEDNSTNVATLGPSSANNALGHITQYGLDTLKAVDQVLKRNQIAGNRYNEQLLARYGIKIDNLLVGRSEYLGYTEQRISIGEVMSTADTSSASEASNLGDYAGRGVGSSVSNFHCRADEFGMMMCISCIQVQTGYPYGYKRELVKHLDVFDFFTPEFDTLGTQPIARGEIFSQIREHDSQLNPGTIFGWSPRYSEYKCSMDNLHGDFICARFKTGMDSWHLFRDVSDIDNQTIPNMTFLDGDPNGRFNQFDRIFNVNAGQDHFIAVHDVNIQAYRNMKSLSDSVVTEGSREVTVGYNGSNF